MFLFCLYSIQRAYSGVPSLVHSFIQRFLYPLAKYTVVWLGLVHFINLGFRNTRNEYWISVLINIHERIRNQLNCCAALFWYHPNIKLFFLIWIASAQFLGNLSWNELVVIFQIFVHFEIKVIFLSFRIAYLSLCSTLHREHTYTGMYRSCPPWCLFKSCLSLFVLQIDSEEYGEALSLARAYNLDSDLVYQRQWRKSTVSIASIQDYLVRDRRNENDRCKETSKRGGVATEKRERVEELYQFWCLSHCIRCRCMCVGE